MVEHFLPIKPDFCPFQQPPKRILKTRPTRYAGWFSNIVQVMKINGKPRVCIYFRDLNLATPKDIYVMLVVDMLIDATSKIKLLSFMDSF